MNANLLIEICLFFDRYNASQKFVLFLINNIMEGKETVFIWAEKQ